MYGKTECWLLLIFLLMGVLLGNAEISLTGLALVVEGERAVLNAPYTGDGFGDSESLKVECVITLSPVFNRRSMNIENIAKGFQHFPCDSNGSGKPYVEVNEDPPRINVVLQRIPQKDEDEMFSVLYVILTLKSVDLQFAWAAIILGSSNITTIANTYLVQSGTTVNVKDFPRLQQAEIDSEGLREEWIFNGNVHNSTLEMDEESNGKTLTYVVSDTNATFSANFNIAVFSTTIPRHINDSFLVRDGSSIRLTDFPRLSPEDCKRMNVTEQWYLNGRETSCTLITVDRSEKPPFITYVLTDTNMKSARYDYNIIVAYGPPPNVTIEPAQSVYIVRDTDTCTTIPTIRCEVDCFPPCVITWSKGNKKLSETNTLSLGLATAATTGKYTCTARNNVTRQWTTGSIFIYTEDPEDDIVQYILYGLVGVLTLACVTLVLLQCRTRKHRNNSTNNEDTPESMSPLACGRIPPESAIGDANTYTGLKRLDRDVLAESQYTALDTDVYEVPL